MTDSSDKVVSVAATVLSKLTKSSDKILWIWTKGIQFFDITP